MSQIQHCSSMANVPYLNNFLFVSQMGVCLIPALRGLHVPAPLMVPGSVVPVLLVTMVMVSTAKILMR